MTTGLSLTLNEAGYVVEQSSTAINRAVDRGVIKATLQRRGNTRLRKVGAAELRFLAIAGEVERKLTPAGRRAVYEAIRRLSSDDHQAKVGIMEFSLIEADRRIAARLQRLHDVKALIDERDGVDAVLRGSNVSVHEIAALVQGQTIEEILEDYPGLARNEVEAAVEFAKVYPRTGRPLPTRSFKRMLADMAQSGVWDVETEKLVEPRTIP
jgi:uncharacterized protein (DUF433 family)